jgi:hypothetical protein
MPFFKIIATTIGNDAGPFVIRSNTGAILATGVTRQQLLDGYTLNVPTGVTSVNIQNAPSNTTCTGTTTLPIPLSGAWEMEKSNVETISDHYGVLFNTYTAPVESFVAQDIVGIYAGVVSGTGTWLIKGTSEDIAGTTYGPGGTLIITGVNTNTQTTVESGAKLQIGFDTDSYTGRTGVTLTINAGGKVDVVGANEPTGRVSFVNLVNNGEMNIIGPDRCGEGYFSNAGTIANNSTIKLTDSQLRLINTTTFTGTGIIDVTDGSTLENFATTIPATQTLKLTGCGKCNDIGTYDGALLVVRDTTIASPILLQSDVCIDHTGVGNTTISGQISGNYKLKLNNQADSSTRSGSFSFTSNTAPFFDNTIEVKNVGLYQQGANALSKADVVLQGTALIQQDSGTINLGSLSGEETTGILANSSVTVVLKENGSTTYAGSMSNSTPGTPWTFRIEGPDTNVIKLTDSAGNTAVNLNSITGGRIIVENGRYRQWTGVGTISAGSTRSSGSFVNSRIDLLTLGASSALDVYASGNTTGLLTGGTTTASAGWTVNLMEPLPAGTHQILRKQATPIALPTLGTNLSGRTVVGFTDNGSYIEVTLV